MSKPCPDGLSVKALDVYFSCLDLIPKAVPTAEKIIVKGSRGKTKPRHAHDRLARPDSDWDIHVFDPQSTLDDRLTAQMIDIRRRLRHTYKVYVDITISNLMPRSPHYVIWEKS